MARKIYKVTGTVQVEISKWVKANSEEEAMDLVQDMSIYLEDYMNDTVGVGGCDDEATEISEAGSGDCIEWNSVEEDEGHDYDESTARYGYEIWLEGNMIHDSGEDEFEDFDIKEIEL